MTGERILVIEDEARIAQFIERGLIYEGYRVNVARDGQTGLTIARDNPPDLVILDWMLPGQDGPELIQHLRESGIHTPILLLTAKVDVDDRVRGLDAGADLTKPFAFEELFARLCALVRREQRAGVQRILEAGPIRIDTARHQVKVDGQEVELRPKAHRVLELLLPLEPARPAGAGGGAYHRRRDGRAADRSEPAAPYSRRSAVSRAGRRSARTNRAPPGICGNRVRARGRSRGRCRSRRRRGA